MSAAGWVAVITAIGTTAGAITALVIAINKLFNSVPSHLVKPVDPIGKPSLIAPANPNTLP